MAARSFPPVSGQVPAAATGWCKAYTERALRFPEGPSAVTRNLTQRKGGLEIQVTVVSRAGLPKFAVAAAAASHADAHSALHMPVALLLPVWLPVQTNLPVNSRTNGGFQLLRAPEMFKAECAWSSSR